MQLANRPKKHINKDLRIKDASSPSEIKFKMGTCHQKLNEHKQALNMVNFLCFIFAFLPTFFYGTLKFESIPATERTMGANIAIAKYYHQNGNEK